MAKKKIFVSFDFEHDKNYKFLLEAWDANKEFEFTFKDLSSEEINSSDVSRVKAALTTKINLASITLVIVGKYSNSLHPDRVKIGFSNWQNFEIAQSKSAFNKIVAVKLDRSYESPSELLNCKTCWAMSFTQEAIMKALNN